MKPAFEKFLSIVFIGIMCTEVVLSLYLLYIMSNVWVTIGFIACVVCASFFTATMIMFAFEDSPESLKPAMASFQRLSELLIFFPIRAIILYYVYISFDNGLLYISIFLLFLTRQTSTALDITSSLADEVYNKQSVVEESLKRDINNLKQKIETLEKRKRGSFLDETSIKLDIDNLRLQIEELEDYIWRKEQ